MKHFRITKHPKSKSFIPRLIKVFQLYLATFSKLLTFGRFNVAIENTLFDFEAGLSLELTFAFRGTNDLIEKFGIGLVLVIPIIRELSS